MVHLAFGFIDMRKGIDGPAMLVLGILRQESRLWPSLRIPGPEDQPHQDRALFQMM